MTRLSPQTLTTQEQAALLARAEASPREALLFSLALGTGLRLAEIVGLDVGDVFLPGGVPRVRVRLRREIAKRGRVGDLFVPDRLRPKLIAFWAHKRARGERLDLAAPLFCAQSGRRLSKRRVQVLFRELQVKAGFDRLYPICERDRRIPWSLSERSPGSEVVGQGEHQQRSRDVEESLGEHGRSSRWKLGLVAVRGFHAAPG
jgi:integrase